MRYQLFKKWQERLTVVWHINIKVICYSRTDISKGIMLR